MQNKPEETIYDILGIKPDSPKTHADKPEVVTEELDQSKEYDTNAPSGSIFDRYSTYPKEEQGYWRYFRILTIVGIATCVGLIVAGLWGDSISFPSSSRYSYSSLEETDDHEYAYDEPTEEVAEDTEHSASSMLTGTKYFKGRINGKYALHMELDFNDGSGRYYYDRSGVSNCLPIVIVEATPDGDGNFYLVLEEYNQDEMLTGTWRGYFDSNNNTYKGTGDFNGKEMPFEIEICSYYETDFSNQ